MPLALEDYGMIGDTQAAALVGRDGSLDWLCLPRFDSPACFAALLGEPRHGRWLIAPMGAERATRWRYRPGTLVLDSEWETDEGAVRVTDCMPVRDRLPDVVRAVTGLRGRVRMRMELIVRFDYGSIVPWVVRKPAGLTAVGGPDALVLQTSVPTRGENLTTRAEFSVGAGDFVPFTLAWHPSHERAPRPLDARAAIADTESWWTEWSGRSKDRGEWNDAVTTSLCVLKGLTYAPTGGIVAAPTTSVPERPGGVRNWDYRFCWLRDATLVLLALLRSGHTAEAVAWRDWLLRAVAGRPEEMQIMYGVAGERRLTELELPWLPGYAGSRPVRIGNAAAQQSQLDVYGELMDALSTARATGVATNPAAWAIQKRLLDFLEGAWREPDEGIWEMRGGRRQFTHSKVMAWVAFDRAVEAVQRFGLDGDADRWRRLRDEVHAEVCREGFDPERNTFTQSYGSRELDASLLMIPLTGFLPPSDRRVAGTVDAILAELVQDGFVARYPTRPAIDGLPPGEAAFLPCTAWLADVLALLGRAPEARAVFARLLAARSDLGLLAEEYDPVPGRLLGNFPQAFSHIAIVNTARNLSEAPPTPPHAPEGPRPQEVDRRSGATAGRE